MNFILIRWIAKVLALLSLTVLVGVVIYAEFAGSGFSIHCVSGDYNYGCGSPNLNVVLVTIIAYILAVTFVLRWRSK